MIDYKMVNKKISPFKFLVHDEETQSVRGSLIYYPDGEYRQEVFDTREDEGFDFDPEGSMFCAYSSNIDALATFALGFKEFCDDSESMIDLFSRAELD